VHTSSKTVHYIDPLGRDSQKEEDAVLKWRYTYMINYCDKII